MKFIYALIVWIFCVILSVSLGYCAATRVVTEDTKTFEIRSLQGLVLEKGCEREISIDQDLEDFFYNDLTFVQFERDETLLAFHYCFRTEIPEDLLRKLRSSYFKIVLLNEEGWAEEFVKSEPTFDFPSGPDLPHWEVLKSSYGIPEVCDLEDNKTENVYCIFVPLKNAAIEKRGFWLRIHLDSIFAFEESFAKKLRINRVILILNIMSDKEVNYEDKTVKNSTFFVIFFPIQYEFSIVAGSPPLKWEHELSGLSLPYGNVLGALQDSFVISRETRSYLVAIWALITSIAISVFSIIIGMVNSKETDSSIRKWDLQYAYIEELTERYFGIKEEMKKQKLEKYMSNLDP